MSVSTAVVRTTHQSRRELSRLLPTGRYNKDAAIGIFVDSVRQEVYHSILAGAMLYLIHEIDGEEAVYEAIDQAAVSERRARDYILIGRVYGQFLGDFKENPEWLREIPLGKLEVAARFFPISSFRIDDGRFMVGPFDLADFREMSISDLRDLALPYSRDLAEERRRLESEMKKIEDEKAKLEEKLDRYRRGMLDYDFSAFERAHLAVMDALDSLHRELSVFVGADEADKTDADTAKVVRMVGDVNRVLANIQGLLLKD